MGDGGGQPLVLQPADGPVDRAPGPAGDGDRLQPVEEGHVGQEPQQLTVQGPHSPLSSSSASWRGGSARLVALGALLAPLRFLGLPAALRVLGVLALPELLQLPAVLVHQAAQVGVALVDVPRRRDVALGQGADALGPLRISPLRLYDLHGEGVHPLRLHGGADVALVHGQGRDVVLGHPLLAQLPDKLPCVVARHLEDGQAAHVGQQGVPHGAGEVVQLGEALGRQDEAGPELPKLRQHGLVVHAGHGLHLVHHQSAPPLAEGQAALLPYHGVHQVEEGRAHQGGHVPSRLALGGGDKEDAALPDGLSQVDGGSGLAQDGPGPPLEQEGVGDVGQHLVAEVVVGQDAQPVQDGVLLACVPALVGLVEALDGLLQYGLHPRPPLVPEALAHAHDGIGGAVRSEKMRASSRLTPGAPRSSARSMSRTLSMRDSGTCSSSPPTRSAWGSTTTMASLSLLSAFSRILWTTMCYIRVDLPMRVRAT